MIKSLNALTIAILSICAATAAEDGFTPLFDGRSLEGWTAARSTGEDDWGAFSVNQQENAIHAYAGKSDGSEQASDCLVSKGQYSHYILKLEYKWLGNRFAPRADWDRDAGLLFHVHGDLKRIWPRSLEMQIGETPGTVKGKKRRFHTGDLWVLGKELRTTTSSSGVWYDPTQPKTRGKHVMTELGFEKPKGEWNEMEIHVHGSEKVTFILNGEIVLETFDFVDLAEDGSTTPLAKGHIGLQAEWAEILYRNIRIKELQ